MESREEKALAGIGPTGHSEIHIKSELDNPIYAAGNPRITTNPKPTGWGASPRRSGREMKIVSQSIKIVSQSINYFWVALLSSLVTYGITKYVEFSEPPVFEQKIGSAISPFRIAVFDISEHPGAEFKTYEFRSYVDGMSLPRSTLLLISKEELNEFRIESIQADTFRIYSKNTLLASCTKESWSLHYGLLNI